MYALVSDLTHDHDPGLVVVAALVCVVGSCLTVLLTRRMIAVSGKRRRIQIALTSLIGGATIWSTHFIAMLSYDPREEHGYDPVLTALSLGIAVLGMLAVKATLASRWGAQTPLLSGALFGGAVSLMHYVGMSAYQLAGHLVWNATAVAISILAGMIVGAAAYHRIVYPVTRYCWMGGAVLMVIAICTMHFTGMGAFRIQLDDQIAVPQSLISDTVMSLLILAVMAVILFVGFASFSIETNLEIETRGRLEHAALHDPLTDLWNRMGLDRRMADLTADLEQDAAEHVAVLTIDLNRFKEINDLYGHAAGDVVLRTVAARLSGAITRQQFIARAGGDEFIALMWGIDQKEAVLAFAEHLHSLIVAPIDIAQVSSMVGASIGIATSLDDGRVLRDLLCKSDLAMYRAKTEQTGDICFYDAQMDEQSRDTLLLIQDLRHACARDEFELVYQLQNDIRTRAPIGFEALLRWNHPTRGRVSPADFIPIAEKSGLIREIGLWVLRTACAEAASWPEPFSIAVNVAPQQLVQPSFVEQVSDILMETRLAPERLELEVTEASIIDDMAHTSKIMFELKAMGIRIAMDDFGTGYSSLATLQAFPFDKIKIDRSFIQDIHKDEQRAAIVRSTVLLGTALDIPVLAEGVEVEAELDFLRAESCTSAQGYYFGKPLSLEDMRAMVHDQARKRAS
ncbi:bifunctional diguanylate cyclase/phosphodiesterase [Actibacterium sp. 188UL27-1]|uniref:putative bifunctional diguanylate cyclase/phosphodiesterase n=1 Tax=Actibacterium sp. 188UL27-1 TaxID=2786961 RepID=UPI001956E4D1|nr:EAL domain-containing protein [Actibacterium sp. 188UL27-1]MBM7066983.1 EAL domain-containing protein [Actibacterium sp. 188UL27-1]